MRDLGNGWRRDHDWELGVLRLAHLTDIHLAPLPPLKTGQLMSKRVLGFVSWHRFRKQRHRREVLDHVVSDIQSQSVDHIVVTGDLTNISLSAEFRTTAAWLRRLGEPDRVTVIPGNHDAYVPGAGEKGWALWADYMRGEGGGPLPSFPFIRRVERVVLLGLSTAVPTPAGYASGLLGLSQLALMKKALKECAGDGCCRVVLLHHPPVEGWSKPRKELTDASAFRAAIAEAGAELVLCGHEHVLNLGGIEGPDGPVPVVGGPAASLLGHDVWSSGGYVLYELSRAMNGWRVECEVRRFDPVTRAVRSAGRTELTSTAGRNRMVNSAA
jgi:3',5'-cyclic AMP phosphodiesterase CpdA